MNSKFSFFKLFVFFALVIFLTRGDVYSAQSSRSRSRSNKTSTQKAEKENQSEKENKEKDGQDQQKKQGFGDRQLPNGRDNSNNSGKIKYKPALLIEEQFEKVKPEEPIVIKNPAYQSADGVFMTGYFMKGKADEETVPVILIHDQESQASDLSKLAQYLAQEGMAVLVPDLRGHGECFRRVVKDYSNGQRSVNRMDDTYTADTFVMADYQAMINYDGMFWYQFLCKLHNLKKLNLRKLVIVGSGLGCAVSLGWAKNDWSQPNAKVGRFVKVMVFISPVYKQCEEFIETMKRKKDQLYFLGFVGNMNADLLKDMKKVQSELGGKHGSKQEENKNTAEWLEKKRFPYMAIKTETNGTALLANDSFGVMPNMKKYIDLRINGPKMKNFKWSEIELGDK